MCDCIGTLPNQDNGGRSAFEEVRKRIVEIGNSVQNSKEISYHRCDEQPNKKSEAASIKGGLSGLKMMV